MNHRAVLCYDFRAILISPPSITMCGARPVLDSLPSLIPCRPSWCHCLHFSKEDSDPVNEALYKLRPSQARPLHPLLFSHKVVATMAEALVQTFQETFGAAIMGGFLAMGLYGITTSQTYFYFVEYPKDKNWRKILVWVLWVLSTLHAAFMIHLLYHYLILNTFNLFELTQNDWSLPASMIVHILVAFLVMTYFLSIIFQFSKPKLRWWLTVPNAIAILLHIGFGIESVIHLLQTRSLFDLPAYTKVSFMPMAVTQAVADVLLASSLCFVLYNHRTAFKKTNSVVDTLMIYAVNRCLLTAGAGIASLLMITIKPDSLIYIGTELLFAGLYTNALLAALNSRHRIRVGWNGDDNTTSDFTSVHLSNVRSNTLAASEPHTHTPFSPRKLSANHPSMEYDGGVQSVDDFKQEVV
ncbi:hypothetical protein B0H13DRAFT_1970947 [Mycena leptocephala]|nr:hypothetical protein B0H13DRAFT_1970947 [Mycena leptocephala]